MISVIIPAFRASVYIKLALESVINKSIHENEIIVVDDNGLDDGTQKIVEEMARDSTSTHIYYLKHDKNLGVSQARKTGWKASRGEFIAFLDADDLFLPEKLETSVRLLEEHPKAVLIHTPVLRGPDYPHPLTSVADWSFQGMKNKLYRYEESIDYMSINRICNSSVVCRRRLITDDCFPPRLRYQTEDWYLWLRLAQHGTFLYHPEPLTFYRDHSTSYFSRLQGERGEHELARLEVLATFFPHAVTARRRYLCAKHLIGCLVRLVDFHQFGEARMNSRPGFWFRSYLFLAACLTWLRALSKKMIPVKNRSS